MAPSSKYVVEEVDEDGIVHNVLQDDANINRDTVSNVTFKFTKSKDITESLEKSNKPPGAAFTNKRGRIAYSSGSCVYPDGTSVQKVPIQGCIVAHRPKATGDYGVNYVSVGVHNHIVDKICKDAKSSGVNVEAVGQRVNGYTWMNMDLKKLDEGGSRFMYLKEGDEVGFVEMDVRQYTDAIESNASVTAFVTIGASQTTSDLDTHPDLAKGTHNLALKPNMIYLLGKSDVEAPAFEFEKRKAEKVAISEQLLTSPDLAEMLLKKMNLT